MLLAFAVLLGSAWLAVDSRAAVDPCPNAEFRKGFGTQLPGCRAYEQVSPVDKNGGDVRGTPGNSTATNSVAVDGGRAVFTALTELGGDTGGTLFPTFYLAERTPSGWGTVPISPRTEPASAGVTLTLSSSDLSHSLFVSTGLVTASNPPLSDPGDVNLFMRDNDAGTISPVVALHTIFNQFNSVSASPDVSHVAFVSGALLTADPGVPASESTSQVYEYVNGQIRLVSVLPDGTPVPGEARTGFSQTSASWPSSVAGAVSDDGRHIFFSTFPSSDPDAIYRRTDGTTTKLVSPSELTPPDPEGPRAKRFHLATSDGNRVFFSSPEQLTDDANTGAGPGRPGNDLYRYDIDADDLVDVSATPVGNGAEVVGVLGSGAGGDHVYYVARGLVVPGDGPGGAPDPIAGEPNLYAWEDDGTPDGVTRFVATLSMADDSNWLRTGDGTWTARATPDGSRLLFQSQASIPGGGSGGVTQLYLYDVEADADGQLICVSCNPAGDTPIGPSMTLWHQGVQDAQPWELAKALSDDGRRVFFSSQDDLVSGDGNGEIDAYMWEDGEVSLLSTGTSSRPSYFQSASSDGDEAFFVTDTKLVPQDIDDLLDLYVAKVGGGFPAPAERADCLDEQCQGEGAVPPVPGPSGSADLRGEGDVKQPARLALGLKRPSSAQLRKLARGGRIGLRARVNRAAVVRVVLKGKVAGRRRVVGKGAASARRAGSVVIGIRLSKQARRQLARTGPMRLSLTVRAGAARPRTLSLHLKGVR